MRTVVTHALVTSAILLLIAVPLYSWWNISGIAEDLSGVLPSGLRAEVREISDPGRLRELAILLVDSQEAYAQDIRDLLDRMMDFVLLMAVMGTVFIWVCTLSALKQLKLQRGEPPGWLGWF